MPPKIPKAKKVLNSIESLKPADIKARKPDYKTMASYVDVSDKAVTPSAVYKQTEGHNEQALQEFLNVIHQKFAKKPVAYLQQLVGRKFMTHMDERFDGANPDMQRRLLEVALADDIGSVAMGALKAAGPPLLRYAWNMIKDKLPVRRIRQLMKDTLGIDTNDDLTQSHYNYTPPTARVDWQEMDPSNVAVASQFNGVAVQAIASILAPEYTSCRIPSDSGIKTALYSRVMSTTVSTNAAGNAIFVLYPQRVVNQAVANYSYYKILNDVTLDLNTGSQTPACSFTEGPLYNYISQIQQYRVTATAVEIQGILSSLNNSGRVISVMGNANYIAGDNSAPVGLNNIKDREYQVYTAMPQINGHRMVYVNNDLIPGQFSSATSTSGSDYIQIMISGSAPNVAALQITVYYQVELIPLNSLADIAPPPIGPATQQAMREVLRIPRLRLLGHQEITQLYTALIETEPTYEGVLAVCRGIKFTHSHDYVGFGSGGDSSSYRSQPNFPDMPVYVTS